MQCPFIQINKEFYYCPIAEFGSLIKDERLEGKVVIAEPLTGEIPFRNSREIHGNIAFVERGTCDFVTKATHAKIAGAIGLVVANNDMSDPTAAFVMTAGSRHREALRELHIDIPSVMLSYESSLILKDYIKSSPVKDKTVSIAVLNATEANSVLERQYAERKLRKQRGLEEEERKRREKQQKEAAELLRSRLGIASSLSPEHSYAKSKKPMLREISSNNDKENNYQKNYKSCSRIIEGNVAIIIFDVQSYCIQRYLDNLRVRNNSKQYKYASFEKPLVKLDENDKVMDDEYIERDQLFQTEVLSNIQMIQREIRKYRENSMHFETNTSQLSRYEVIYSIIENQTTDGRDNSKAHEKEGIYVPKNSRESSIDSRILPHQDEIVIPRTGVSLFSCTNINYLLRAMNIRTIVCVGVSTLNSIFRTAVDAMDLGIDVHYVHDAIAWFSQSDKISELQALENYGGGAISTVELLQVMIFHFRIPQGKETKREDTQNLATVKGGDSRNKQLEDAE